MNPLNFCSMESKYGGRFHFHTFIIRLFHGVQLVAAPALKNPEEVEGEF